VRLLGHVVAIKDRVLAEDHPSRLVSQQCLASAYQANGQIKEAVRLLEHVVAIQGRVLAEDHPDRLASHRALAWAHDSERYTYRLEPEAFTRMGEPQPGPSHVIKATENPKEAVHESQNIKAVTQTGPSQAEGKENRAKGFISRSWHKWTGIN
jgi:hypothetical protein